MSENNFTNTVESLFKGMDAFITTKTVVGDAVRFDDGTIVLPLVDGSRSYYWFQRRYGWFWRYYFRIYCR